MSGRHNDWPDGWELVTIGDIAVPKVQQGVPNTDFTYIDIGSVNNRTKQIESTKEFTAGNKIPSRAQQHVRPGDVLVSMTRPNLNAVAKVPTELDGAICSTGFEVLRPIEVEPDWLFLIVKSRPFVDAMTSLVQGALYPAVRPADVRAYKFALPPLAEQQRIVAKIEALQDRSRRAREALAEVGPLLEQFRQSVLAAAFRGDLTADWRAAHPNIEPASELLLRIRSERRRRWEQAELAKYEAKRQKPPKNWEDKYEEPEPVEAIDLPKLPEGWLWVNVDEISTKVTDGVHKKPNYVESGIPFLTVKNLTAGPGISFNDTRFVTEADHQEFIKRTHPEKGDILVTKDGTLGIVRIIESEQVFSIFVSLALIKPVFRDISPFLVSMLQSPQGQAGMKVTGTGLQHIHLVDLRATVIPLPPEAELRVIVKRIEERLEGIGIVFDEAIKCLEDLDSLDQSILAKAFRGELVPQDPNDEPALVLLARIREQRVQQAEAPKGIKKITSMQRRDAMRKKASGLSSQHRPLVEVLTTKGKPMLPEQLLTESGYDDDSIEDFYLALREEIAKGRIRENRPTESNVTLEAVKQ